MPKNICYSNHQMATWIKTVLVALVAIVAIGITNTGETKKMDQYGSNGLTNLSDWNGMFAPTSNTPLQISSNPADIVSGGGLDYTTPGGGITYSGAPGTAIATIPLGAVAPPQKEDQYAAQLAAQRSSARNTFNQGRSNILSDIQNSAGNYLQTGRNNILDFLDSLRTQQQGLDTQRANAALGQKNASKGILNMVGQGIKSFGVNLANRNAGDSSAALAGAQAYGRMGNQQMQDVNQQLGLENANIDVAQQGLNTSRDSGKRKLETEKAQTVNNLTNYAQQQFTALNAQAEGAGIMDRIAIEQEKENVKNQLIQQLAELDAKLGEANTINPMDQMAVQNKAQELSQLGQGGTQFDFTNTTPTQLQTGAQLGQLPIFSNRRKRA